MLQKQAIIDKIKIIDETEGEGIPADDNTIVHVNIAGYDESGKLFYKNNILHPLRVYAGDLSYPPGTPGYLPGLVYGVLGIKKNQKRTIIFPPELAYNISKKMRGKDMKSDNIPNSGPNGLNLDSYVVMELECKHIEQKDAD